MVKDVYETLLARRKKLAVIGLGYVGLPLAIAFSKKVDVIGFDVDHRKVDRYLSGIDATGEVGDKQVKESSILFTADPVQLEEATFFIITVPTPIQSGNVPDLTYVQEASQLIAKVLTKGAVVVYESTVYPGVTEELCIPLLEQGSGLQSGVDFKVGYSPERINPGDKENKLENIIKIVSGMDDQTLAIIKNVYELIIHAGIHCAESIKVAEAAKVVENAQRDINIAFMNELSMLFHDMNIDTQAVLRAAETKWNFLPFTPGLVGGHCISIDPYYLTYKAEDIGYHSQMMLAARRINDGMGKYVAGQIVKIIVRMKDEIKKLRVGILGVTYKENCPDFRNSKVIDIIHELEEYNIVSTVVDPFVDQEELYAQHRIVLTELSVLEQVDVLILAVPHQPFIQMDVKDYEKLYNDHSPKIMIDLKGVYPRTEFEKMGFYYWSL